MLKKISAIALIVGLLILPSLAQITTTSFGASVPVSTLNSNFSTLGSQALNRATGTITGNIAVNSGVTIDGVDISATLGGTGTPTFSTLTVSSTSASALDVAGGINAGSGNVGIVDSSGKIPAISSTYFANLSGANLTGITFSQLTTTWTPITFSAGNFTSATGTWVVGAGDVVSLAYVEFGKTMIVTFDVQATTLTGAPTELRMAIPNSRTAARSVSTPFNYSDNGTPGTGTASVASTYISLYKAVTAPAWSNATDASRFQGTITFEIS